MVVIICHYKVIINFYSTYEALKPAASADKQAQQAHFYSTYEALKLQTCYFASFNYIIIFTLPMRH